MFSIVTIFHFYMVQCFAAAFSFVNKQNETLIFAKTQNLVTNWVSAFNFVFCVLYLCFKMVEKSLWYHV